MAAMPLPNIHLLALFIGASTIIYRSRALFAIYVFVFLDALIFQGFTPMWLPKLYLYLPLWAMFMGVAKLNAPVKLQVPLYAFVAALHGLMFGTLWAPAQAVIFGTSFSALPLWIAHGIPFDLLHMVGNFSAGLMIVPFVALLRRLNQTANIKAY